MRYGLIELGSVEQLMFPVKLINTVTFSSASSVLYDKYLFK